MPVTQPAGAITTAASGTFEDTIFSNDGSRLYVDSGNTVSVIDTATDALITSYTFGTSLGAMDLSPDGRYLAVAEEWGAAAATLYRIDLTTGAVSSYSTPLDGPAEGSFYDVAFLADGTALLTQRTIGYGLTPLRVLDFATGQFSKVGSAMLGYPDYGAATLTASHDHTHVQIDPGNVTTYVYVSGSGVVANVSTAPSDPYAGAALPPTDGTGVQATSPSANLYVQGGGNVYDGSLHLVTSLAANDFGMTFSADGKTLYSAEGNFIFAIDTSDWQTLGAYQLDVSAALAHNSISGTDVGFGDVLRPSPDGHYLSVITTNGIDVIDLTKAQYAVTNGDDTVAGSGSLIGLGGNDDLTSSGPGPAYMAGGPGDDTYHVNNYYDQVIELPNEGHDTVHATVTFSLSDNVEDLVLDGSSNINGFGNSLDNSIIGNSGDNFLAGGGGNDHVQGGAGNDTLDGGPGTNILDGGDGNNTASYGSATGAVTVDLNQTGPQNTIGDGTDTLINIQNLTGSNYDDHLTGDSGANRLDGGMGADTLVGGTGDDTYVVDNPGDVVIEQPGEGHDVVLASGSYTIPDNVEELTLVSYGTATGNGLDNVLNDAAGGPSNILLGMGGNDTLNGDLGGEILAGGAGADLINGGAGNDTIYAGDVSPYWNVPYGYWQNVTLPLLDRGSEVDTLNGGPGLDTIFAGYGDFVDGGADKADLLISLAGATAGVNVDFHALDNGGTLTINGGLIQNIRSVQWIEGTNFDDTITGSDTGDDYGHTMAPIYGLGGNDHIIAGQNTGNIYGGDGNDTIEVHLSDASTPTDADLYGDAGDDVITVTGSGSTYPIATAHGGDGNDTLTLAGRIFGDAGNDTINVSFNPNQISYASGGAGDDTITGSASGDVLDGGSGDDVITGGAGADTLTGGLGADTFKDTAGGFNGDTITDFAGGDKIVITDATVAGFSFDRSGDTLTYTGGTITVDGLHDGKFEAAAAAGGGVELSFHSSAHNDFNDDGLSDIVWRNDSGQLNIWQATGNGDFTTGYSSPLPTDLSVAGTADFNGDGQADLLLRNATTGETDVWLSNSSGSFTPGFSSNVAGTDWHVAGTGDFNGDGLSDIVWRNDNGQLNIWQATGNGDFTTSFSCSVAGTDWHVVGTGDFNGDGLSDIVWRNDNGQLNIWQATGNGDFTTSFSSSVAGTDWHVVGTGDFNGDGLSDIVWRNDNGQLNIWQATGNGDFTTSFSSSVAGTDWHVVGTGDFNGDGLSDIVWRNDNGQLNIWQATGNGDFVTSFSSSVAGTDWHVQDNGIH